MLIINGALAVFNGLIVQTRKFWCECVLGGVCCNGVCHCDEGQCCNDEWKTEPGYCCGDELWSPENDPDAPCEEGWTFLRWGDGVDQCCGCVSPEIMDPAQNGGIEGAENVAASLCCPACDGIVFRDQWGECPGRCCENGNCQNKKPSECAGEVLGGCCDRGCPVPCCDPDGESCEVIDQQTCPAPLIRGVGNSCDEATCVGACCVYDEENGYVLHESSPTTKANCDGVGGEFQGVGTTECLGCTEPGFPQDARCRPPFDACCCEEKTSKAAGLTFYQPRTKRLPPISDTVWVRVELESMSAVRVHGELYIPTPYDRCVRETIVFPLCWDAFNVEPVPCGSNFQDLKIKVCWDQLATDLETLKFSGCNNITVWLGNCLYECKTVMTYEGPGHTSNASIVMRGDGEIRADGTGPLVLTSAVTHAGNCDRTLALAGSSTHLNEIRRIGDPAGSNVCNVVKEGSGLWRMNATSKDFNGTLTVKGGTMQVANAGAVGSPVAIGDTAVGASGIAALLLEQGVNTSASFDVRPPSGSQVVLIGGANTSGTATFSGGNVRMSRDVTLVAATGGTVRFENRWAGVTNATPASQNVTIGAAGYAGRVVLDSSGTFATSGSVAILYGTVSVALSTTLSAAGGLALSSGTALQVHGQSPFGIDSTTAVTAASATITVQEEPGDPPASQSLDELTVTGTLTLDGSGSLTVADLSGAGSIVNEDGTLTINQNSMAGSLSITGGTVIANEPITNPGGLVTSATFTSSTLTVAFSGDPATGAEYVLLAGPTVNSYGTVTLTGTTKAGTYNSATSTLTIT
jgi:autotransporter-associated beta strand protein